MQNPKIKLTTGLAVALTVLSFLIGGPQSLEPSAEKSAEKASSGQVETKGEAKPVPEEHKEPKIATRPPRVGDIPRRLAALPENASSGEKIAAFLSEPRDLSDPARHADFVATLRRLEDLQMAETAAKADQLGLPLLTQHGSYLTGFAGDTPLYDISHNADAAKSIGTDLVLEAAPYFPNGEDHQIGLWDVYYGATTSHNDLPQVHLKDSAVEGGIHASHVAGTLSAFGYDPQAQGGSPQAEVWSFSSDNMLSEIAANSAQNGTDFGKLFVSVHPYGVASGWEYDGEEWYGSFSNDGDNSNDVPLYLGQYSSSTSSWDSTAANFPWHLIIKSSGNHGDDNAPAVGATWWLNGTVPYFYNPASDPKSDGAHTSPAGYGTIDARASAKNVLTVGSVSDAVTGGVRDLGAAVLSDFSSVGPTDDGRIKPDLVANGEDVYSVDGSTSDGYLLASGTSMSSASVAAGAQLLNEIYIDYKGEAMRSAILKGLLIHTADDLELPGPDYRTGWGLVNIQAAAELLYDDATAEPQDRIKKKELTPEKPLDYYMVYLDGGPARITLSWTDLAANWTNGHDDRNPRLVNDLNLRLVSEDGTITHYPYVMPFTQTWAESDLVTPAVTGVNTVDNVEQIYLEAPAPGLYRLEVDYAGTLQSSGQKYALLVSGFYMGPLEGVVVENPAADQSFLVTSSNPITVANAQVVFSGTGHQYAVETPGNEILSAAVDAAGNVTVVPTMLGYGPVELTLTATDSTGGTARATFMVTLMSAILRVDSNSLASPAEQNGSSWEQAYSKLQDALEVAIPGQEIWVADGVYYPDERNAGDSNDRQESFIVTNGLALYGGFIGFETLRTERNPNSQDTILSGDLQQDDVQQPIVSRLLPNSGDWNNAYQVVRIAGGANGTLDGFVVTAGKNTNLLQTYGAGIWVQPFADARIANCLISGNESSGEGGGLCNDAADVALVNCLFVGNKAGLSGGGLASQYGETEISHCEFRGNDSSDGGAIYLYKETMTLSNCLISGNTGFFGGGGIHVGHGWFKMVNCTMTGNSTFGQGAAIRVVNSQGNPYVYNTIIWNNMAGGSTTSTSASAHGPNTGKRPYFENSLVANSGGSSNWNWSVGWDGWENIDADPLFAEGIVPTSIANDGGNFTLQIGSAALNVGNTNAVLVDQFDLDGDGDLREAVPFDLAGSTRVISTAVDMGAYEFGNPTQIDGDNDGLSDAFELAYGAGGDLDPDSDNDGDGLTALAEFVHGLNPNEPLRKPVADYAPMQYLGSNYLCMTFLVDPAALNFATITVERRADLNSPAGWLENQAILHSSVQSSSHPGMLEVTYRSLVPFGQNRMEFMRVRHDVIPSGGQTIPQGDLPGSVSVSGWNVWGQ